MKNQHQQPTLLPRTLANEIIAQAQAQSDVEICGLISSQQGCPKRCYPIPNIADQPEKYYRMDPASLINALKDMRAHNEKLFSIYHSHPGSPAEPSATDIREASYPDTLYLIISLSTKGIVELRGFYLAKGQSIEVELLIQ